MQLQQKNTLEHPSTHPLTNTKTQPHPPPTHNHLLLLALLPLELMPSNLGTEEQNRLSLQFCHDSFGNKNALSGYSARTIFTSLPIGDFPELRVNFHQSINSYYAYHQKMRKIQLKTTHLLPLSSVCSLKILCKQNEKQFIK